MIGFVWRLCRRSCAFQRYFGDEQMDRKFNEAAASFGQLTDTVVRMVKFSFFIHPCDLLSKRAFAM
jgi:hypothetical protein